VHTGTPGFVASAAVLGLVLASTSARADFHPAESKRAVKLLGSWGMTVKIPVRFSPTLRSLGLTSSRGIEYSEHADRSQLFNTIAHEMRHGRDRELTDELFRVNEGRLDRLDRLDPGSAAYERLGAKIDKDQAQIRRLSHGPNAEFRAFRAGAFAMGRAGRSLGDTHLTLPATSAAYGPRKRLIDANARGYTLGAKLAMLRSPTMREQPHATQRLARDRVNAYLSGYRQMLVEQANQSYARKPDMAYATPMELSTRKAARRAQDTERLTGTEALVEAGRKDALLALSPLARQAELLRVTDVR
jgi:hypothetical protein